MTHPTQIGAQRVIIGHGRHHDRRISPNSAWPLRCADGRTWAERKEARS